MLDFCQKPLNPPETICIFPPVKMNLESLRREDIMELADSAQIFHQGEEYYESGAVYNFAASANAIAAQVRSETGDYTVKIDDSAGSLEMYCDYPYEGDVCPHIIAVLLYYLNDKEREAIDVEFITADPLEQTLETMSQQELLGLVLQLSREKKEVRRALLASVSIPPAAIRHLQRNPQKVSEIKAAIERLFDEMLYEEEDYRDESEEGSASYGDLLDVFETAKVFNTLDRLEIFGYAIAYGNQILEESPVSTLEIEKAIGLFAETVAMLSLSPEDKRDYFNALIETRDWAMSGYSNIAAAVKQALETLCTVTEDYRYLIYLVKNSSYPQAYQLIPRYYIQLGEDEEYLRDRYSRLETEADYMELAEYWQLKGDREKYLETLEAWVARVLEQEREASRAWYDCYPSAAMESLGIWPALTEFYQNQQHHHNLAKVLLTLAENQSVTVKLYRQIEAIALPLGQWPELQQILLERAAENLEELAKIYIDERDWAAAIELAYQNIDSETVPVLVADSIKAYHPEASIDIYQELVQQHIDRKSREKYRMAADYADAIKFIYLELLRDGDSWQNYIEGIRQSYNNRRALKDEFQGL